MLFHSLEYAIFLVAVFAGFWTLHRARAGRIVWLTLASYVFYAASNPWFLTLILASTVTDFMAGRAMGSRDGPTSPAVRRAWLVLSLCVNLGLLGVFKYANFFY